MFLSVDVSVWFVASILFPEVTLYDLLIFSGFTESLVTSLLTSVRMLFNSALILLKKVLLLVSVDFCLLLETGSIEMFFMKGLYDRLLPEPETYFISYWDTDIFINIINKDL